MNRKILVRGDFRFRIYHFISEALPRLFFVPVFLKKDSGLLDDFHYAFSRLAKAWLKIPVEIPDEYVFRMIGTSP